MHNGDWYALQVYAGKEKWVASMLDDQGYDVLLLLYTTVQEWSDRHKRIDRPVFPGYIFCNFDPHRRSSILATSGVLRIVSVGRTPVPVDSSEIETLVRIADAGWSLAPFTFLKTGNFVRIRGGALDGTIGRVITFRKGLRVVVSISLLERSVSLEIHYERLESLSSNDSSPIRPQKLIDFDGSSLETEPLLPVKRFSRKPSSMTTSSTILTTARP